MTKIRKDKKARTKRRKDKKTKTKKRVYFVTSGQFCTLAMFSNRLPERMQNHTGCNCLISLHCVFSNVSSKFLHRWMHNHTGCKCLFFSNEFFSSSNESSNCLPERLRNHSVYICLTFPHCGFSKVYSNC